MPGPDRHIHDIVFGVDPGGSREGTLRFVADLATRYDARVHALCVTPVDPPMERTTAASREQAMKDVESKAKSATDRAAKRLRELGAKAHPMVRRGSSVANTIRDVVMDLEASVVVVATRGHGDVKQNFLGSTAESVLRTSAVPVIAIPIDPPS